MDHPLQIPVASTGALTGIVVDCRAPGKDAGATWAAYENTPRPLRGTHGETNAAIPRFLRGLNARRCRDKPVENHGRSGTGDRLRR